jgi:hypothetical protein
MPIRKGIDPRLLHKPAVTDPYDRSEFGVPMAVRDWDDEEAVTEDLPMIPVDLVRMSSYYRERYAPFGRIRAVLAIWLARLSDWVAP